MSSTNSSNSSASATSSSASDSDDSSIVAGSPDLVVEATKARVAKEKELRANKKRAALNESLEVSSDDEEEQKESDTVGKEQDGKATAGLGTPVATEEAGFSAASPRVQQWTPSMIFHQSQQTLGSTQSPMLHLRQPTGYSQGNFPSYHGHSSQASNYLHSTQGSYAALPVPFISGIPPIPPSRTGHTTVLLTEHSSGMMAPPLALALNSLTTKRTRINPNSLSKLDLDIRSLRLKVPLATCVVQYSFQYSLCTKIDPLRDTGTFFQARNTTKYSNSIVDALSSRASRRTVVKSISSIILLLF